MNTPYNDPTSSEKRENTPPRTPFTPGTSLSLRFPTDVNLSPDGKHIVFAIRQWVSEQAKPQTRIWIVETSGGEPKPFTSGPKGDNCPRWSPDSQQIAYTSKSEGEKDKPQLYVKSIQGGEAKRVCTMPNGVSDLAWSPDGSRTAFISLESEEPKDDPIVVTTGCHRCLWTVRPDYDIPEPVTPDGVTVWEYAWSPDGRYIAVYYSTGPDETDWYLGQVGVVPASGGAVRQMAEVSGQASALTWSPDSSRIAYISGEWSDRGLVGGDVFVVPLKGDTARNLTPNADRSFSYCKWFPDGRRLLYAAWSGVTHQLGILDEADGTMTTLIDDFVMGELHGPRFSATADLRCFATTHSTHKHPYDVWFGQLTHNGNTVSGVDWRQLSRLNPLLEETVALSPMERIRYESVDGWQIDALFTPPLTSKNDAPPPLVVMVHGGPSSAYVDGWSTWTQLLASAGYAVFQPNFRGSMGHGIAFTHAVMGDMGGKDLQDILYGVDYLIERGLVDGNKVGIMGWSYGGFMAAWAVTQTNRFKAAMMGAGVSDFHSFHAQSNIPDWDMRFVAADPLERPDAYRERSAITYAARVTTPTLIMHGENDECVPVNQAYAFYRALRERNVPAKLVIYPREGHGLVERDHVRDLEERLLRWFEQYLMNKD